MVPEYEDKFMELLRYAPLMNMEKLKINKIVFGINFNIRAKVRILMPQTLHDVVHKALIAEEELNNGVEGNTPFRPTRNTTSWVQHYQEPVRPNSRHRYTSRGTMFMTP